MEELTLRHGDKDLLALLNSIDTDEGLPVPFERSVFLLGTQIAGTSFRQNMDELYEKLQEGDLVKLVREPENEYDEYAIRIDTDSDQPLGYVPSEMVSDDEYLKLGYVPRVNNKILARLMDAGKHLYGVIRLKEMNGSYHHIVVKIYLKD
ncbi:MAG: HIRAN domain-containing protein [Clostridiales bacterium]|nr:HIRAN domain-containing protein [Clostridiales bacterium]